MTFKEWLETQYKTGRLDRAEIEKAVDKLLKEVDSKKQFEQIKISSAKYNVTHNG